MTKFAELLDDKDIEVLAKYAKDAVLDVGAYREGDGSKESTRFVIPPPGSWDRAQEVGEQILGYYHAYMWQHSQPIPSHIKDSAGYARHWYGHLTSVAYALGINEVMTKSQLKGFVSQVSRLLHVNGLAKRVAKGQSKDWLLRPYVAGQHLSISKGGGSTQVGMTQSQVRDEHRVRASLEREGEKPVSTVYDLRTIPMPEPSPEGMVKWASKVIRSYQHLNHAYEEAKGVILELETELRETKQQLDDLSNNEWEEAQAAIAELLKGGE